MVSAMDRRLAIDAFGGDAMNEVIERAVINQRILEAATAPPLPARGFANLAGLHHAVSARHRAPARWKSSLCDADLKCLLQVIEAELIPQLISGYSPALCSPQDLRIPKE